MLQQALSDARMVKIIHVQGLRHHFHLMRITDFFVHTGHPVVSSGVVVANYFSDGRVWAALGQP